MTNGSRRVLRNQDASIAIRHVGPMPCAGEKPCPTCEKSCVNYQVHAYSHSAIFPKQLLDPSATLDICVRMLDV